MPRARTLHFNRNPVNDDTALIASYETKEFASPYRSTIPLLALLKDQGPTLDQILTAVGVDADCGLFSEYQVACTRGRGKPSHTDLMIKSAQSAWAIEAKWTEPRYPTVAEWMAEAEGDSARSANRREVISGWLDLINSRKWGHSPFRSAAAHTSSTPETGNVPISLSAVGSMVYQMIHRAASACAAGDDPVLVYLHFHMESDGVPVEKAFYRSDLTQLHEALGRPDNFPFFLINLSLRPTPAFLNISRLPKGDLRTGEAVRSALLNETLFEFGTASVSRI